MDVLEHGGASRRRRGPERARRYRHGCSMALREIDRLAASENRDLLAADYFEPDCVLSTERVRPDPASSR